MSSTPMLEAIEGMRGWADAFVNSSSRPTGRVLS